MLTTTSFGWKSARCHQTPKRIPVGSDFEWRQACGPQARPWRRLLLLEECPACERAPVRPAATFAGQQGPER